MKLKEMLFGLDIQLLHGSLDAEIRGIEWVFFNVRANDLFIYHCCAVNEKLGIAERAVRRGAAAIITDGEPDCTSVGSITVIRVDTLDGLCQKLCLRFYGGFFRRMTLIGITGTKGKTTTAYMIASMLQKAGYKVGLQTTIGAWTGNRFYEHNRYQPHRFRIYEEMAENGKEILVAEFSSGDMWRGETDGLHFAACVYTNLSMDHVGDGEHPDFGHYRQMKALLFRDCDIAVINGDDPRIREDVGQYTDRIETFGMSEGCTLRGENAELTDDFGVCFKTAGAESFDAFLPHSGSYGIYNALAAISVCRRFHVSQSIMREALAELLVPGRLEEVCYKEGVRVFIDYAHNGISLESVLTFLKSYRPKRLVCLFGCGGNRPRCRRYDMGRVSGQLADLTVITTDNPRNEDPISIINDIKKAVDETGGEYMIISDRTEAIQAVLTDARRGDIILLAGKGHEQYQETATETVRMNDRSIAEKVITGQET